MRGHGITRGRDGAYRVRLRPEERELLQALPAQLDDVLDSADPSLERLFPPGYEHRDDERAFQGLTRDSLVAGKRAALRALADTAGADTLDERALSTWLAGVESLRLVLGTQLDVTEESYGAFDHTHPDAPRLALYHWLSWLQEEIVQALAAGLPNR